MNQGPHRQFSGSVGGAVGRTPVVRLNRISPLCGRHDLFVKLESCNPGGSIKDRNASYLIDLAEKRGLLKPGGTIVESSSGNFGIGLAMVGAARGYRVIIVIDRKTPGPVRKMLLAYGAEIVDIDPHAADMHGSMQKARMRKAAELAAEIPGAYYVCQHKNSANPDVHEVHTAREIEDAFDGAPDALVVGISTAGQIMGLANYLKPKYPHMRLIGVDVVGSVILGTPPGPYKMTGLGLSFVPETFRNEVLFSGYSVTDQLAFSTAHSLARLEGLLLGASTGAIVAAGVAYALGEESAQSILMINPDRGDRYMETVYDLDWLKAQGIEILKGPALDKAFSQLQPVLVDSTGKNSAA